MFIILQQYNTLLPFYGLTVYDTPEHTGKVCVKSLVSYTSLTVPAYTHSRMCTNVCILCSLIPKAWLYSHCRTHTGAQMCAFSAPWYLHMDKGPPTCSFSHMGQSHFISYCHFKVPFLQLCMNVQRTVRVPLHGVRLFRSDRVNPLKVIVYLGKKVIYYCINLVENLNEPGLQRKMYHCRKSNYFQIKYGQ